MQSICDGLELVVGREAPASIADHSAAFMPAREAACSTERPAFSRPLAMNLPKKRLQAP